MSEVGVKSEEDQLYEEEVARQQAEQPEGDSGQQGDDRQRRVTEAAAAVLQRLLALADEQVGAKQQVENRWLADLAQFHGKYDSDTLAKITEVGGSKLFPNQTRPKTTAWAARFGDMLFPTDDKNWGINPTPVPTMQGSDAAQRARQAAQAATRASQMGDAAAEQQHVAAAEQAAEQANAADMEMEEATRRCKKMEKLIDDQLTECNYNIASRETIMDACKLGTGIIKGPVLGAKTRRSWVKDALSGVFGLKDREDARPSYVRVDPWNFFPDSSATRMEDAEFSFERHLPTKKELRSWRKRPGFLKDSIDHMLDTEPSASIPDYLNQLRTITGIDTIAKDKNYLVWEYHGAVPIEDMAALAEISGDEQMLKILQFFANDGLDEVQAIIWFSEGSILLRYGLHPLESGDTLYSAFNFDKDESSIWGFGIPYLMRDAQAAFAAAWRMMMDNGALSSGPQIVVNKNNIEPENGDWKLAPRKVWLRKNDSIANMQPDFQAVQIECRQDQLVTILTTGKTFIDDETLMPPIAYGESGSHITKTAQGISMLMNAVNVIFRFVVKNWDDQITVPNIRRLYDWNMQFASDEAVKGDFDVQARGSSVLLVREIQSQNLMALCANFAPSPIFGPMLKMVALFRKTVASFLINPDEVVKTDAQYEKDLQAAAEAAKNQKNPDIELETLRHQNKMAELKATGEADLMKLAAQGNITMDQLREKLASSERLFAAEAAMTPKDTKGGGGSL